MAYLLISSNLESVRADPASPRSIPFCWNLSSTKIFEISGTKTLDHLRVSFAKRPLDTSDGETFDKALTGTPAGGGNTPTGPFG